MVNKLLNILRKISEIIAKSDDCNAVLSDIVKILAESLNVEVCSVYIHDVKTDELILAATHGLNVESVGSVRMKTGEGLTGHSFKQREMLNVSNPESHPSYKYFASTGEEIYKSFLAVPLSVGGRCVGILTLQRRSADKFPSSVVDMAKALSTQIANLLLNEQIIATLAGMPPSKSPSEEAIEERKGQTLMRGVAASGGVARGKCFLFKPKDVFEEIVESKCQDPEAELKLFDSAVKLAKEKTVDLSKRALSMISEADASIFHAHLLFLDDKSLIDEIRKEISGKALTAEFAVKTIYLDYQRRFMKLGQQIFRDKEMDLKDVMRRIIESIRELRGASYSSERHDEGQSGFILVAEELLPSDLIRLPTDKIAGIVCGKGGATAHVAALAKALDIPALMGVKGVSEKAVHGEDLVLDCHAEILYMRPSEAIVQHFEEMLHANGSAASSPADLEPAATSDGLPVTVRATISLICETSLLSTCGAQGVGLYRTEFFFMIRDYLPTEEEQLKIYNKILKEAKGEEVTIRVLDIGADKSLSYINIQKEDNPALGLRGIRLLLAMKDILKTQLRAILRAGCGKRVKILFPMVAGASEILAIKDVLAEVESGLHADGVAHAESYKLGIMLELPSVLLDLENLIGMVDYMSIGSNDLLQYTFAVDRCNENVAELYTNLHPGFLRLLDMIGSVFARHPDKQLAICGEMAASPMAIPLLIGAGIRDVSVAPRRIPAVKRVVRAYSSEECRGLLKECLSLSSAEAVRDLVRKSLASKGLVDHL